MRHFLKDTDVSIEEHHLLIKVSSLLKRNRNLVADTLKGMGIGLFFEKPSLRTRVSTQSACSMLGAEPILLRSEELHFHRGETPQDAVRVLSGYLNLFMGRVYSHSLLQQLSEPDCIPIVNGLCDTYHPLQALADILTINEAFTDGVKGLKVVYFGDGNNVTTSLALAGAMSGMNVVVCTPKDMSLSEDIQKEISDCVTSSEGTVTYETNPLEAVKGADVLYTDVWTSMGADEGLSSDDMNARNSVLKPYSINLELVKKAKQSAIVMHCLPAHYGEEITREAFTCPNSRIIQQAHNRLPTAVAVFLFCLDREKFLRIARM